MLCAHTQPCHVPPPIPKSLLGCRERSAPSVESWSRAIPWGQTLQAFPGTGDTAGSRAPHVPLGVPMSPRGGSSAKCTCHDPICI